MIGVKAKAKTGVYFGKKIEGIHVFKGIPYAKPPVGALRWKPPVKLEESPEIIEAYEFGKVAIQEPVYSEQASYTAQGEDCLTMNIWTSDFDVPKAVMVFIHGGAFGWGGATDPIYDGLNFVKRRNDVVLVTLQYRLNNLGFMSLAELGGAEYADSGNLGLLDQIQALEWIRENIAYFGGDPENVTIFGESCGGCSVTLLMAMASAKGLFHKVIAQSGCINITQSKSNKSVLDKFLEVSKRSSMDELLEIGEEEMRYINFKMEGLYDFPIRDGRLIPVDPYEAIQKGCADGVKLLIGTNENEWNYWKQEIPEFELNFPPRWECLIDELKEEFQPDKIDRYISLRNDKSRLDVILDFANDIGFRIPAVIMAEKQSGHADTYMYYFKEPSKIEGMGACHAVELAYVFQNFDGMAAIYTGPGPSRELAAQVQDAWVNFAISGDPGTDSISWPKYETTSRATMFIENGNWQVVNDPGSEDRVLLEDICRIKLDLH